MSSLSPPPHDFHWVVGDTLAPHAFTNGGMSVPLRKDSELLIETPAAKLADAEVAVEVAPDAPLLPTLLFVLLLPLIEGDLTRP